MGTNGHSLNSSSLMNNTYVLDYFCTELPVSPLVWCVICVPCACIGVPVSMWLLWVLVQRQRRGLSCVYMLNLTIMDVIYSLLIFPNALNYFFWRDKITLLRLAFFNAFNLSGRPLFMACICVDCYMAVVHPIIFMKITNGRHRLVNCVLVWLVTLLTGFSWVVLENEDIEAFILKFSLGLSVPVISFCDLSVLYTLRKPDPSGRSQVHPQKQRAMQVIINSLVVSVVSYFPLLVVLDLQKTMNLSQQELICNVYFPVGIIATMSSTIMPLIHLRNLGMLKDIRMCAKNG